MKAHDETDPGQRIGDLKAAKKIIYHAASNFQGEHRSRAENLIRFAIEKTKQGDPTDAANQYIEQANKVVG